MQRTGLQGALCWAVAVFTEENKLHNHLAVLEGLLLFFLSLKSFHLSEYFAKIKIFCWSVVVFALNVVILDHMSMTSNGGFSTTNSREGWPGTGIRGGLSVSAFISGDISF